MQPPTWVDVGEKAQSDVVFFFFSCLEQLRGSVNRFARSHVPLALVCKQLKGEYSPELAIPSFAHSAIGRSVVCYCTRR